MIFFLLGFIVGFVVAYRIGKMVFEKISMENFKLVEILEKTRTGGE